MKTNRVMYIVIGIVMFLCLGTIYSWSVFQKPLIAALEANGQEITPFMANLPYTVFLLCYAFSMPFAGKLIDRVNIKFLSIAGAILLSLGWIIASFSGKMLIIVLTYGVLGGIGVGTIYGIPMAVAAKWFPERKGFAVGLTLLGFGMSPFITAPIAASLIEKFGIFPTFRILGVAFLVICSLLSLFLKFPEDQGAKADTSLVEVKNYTLGEMIKTKEFFGLWGCYVIGCTAGLMIIGLSSTYAQEVMKLTPAKAAGFTSFFAIFNGI